MEKKDIPLELKELSKERRTAVIAHSVYNSIDRVGDIATKGMFNKSWRENKNIEFLFNHDRQQILGTVLETFEDEHKAYTKVKFGNWKLADDVMEMADAGVLRGASFGFITEKKEYIKIKDRPVRRLKEVRHEETSLLTKTPAHPDAGVVTLTKSLEIEPEKILEVKERLEKLENFCRNSNASDGIIQEFLLEVKQLNEIFSNYDTAATQLATEPDASRNERKEFANSLFLLTLKHF